MCVSVIYETALNRFPFDFEEEVTLWNTYGVIKLISKVDFYNFVTQSGERNKNIESTSFARNIQIIITCHGKTRTIRTRYSTAVKKKTNFLNFFIQNI